MYFDEAIEGVPQQSVRFALHPLDRSLYPFDRFWEPENRHGVFGARQPPETV